MNENTISSVNTGTTPARSTSRLSKFVRSFGVNRTPSRRLADADAASVHATRLQVELARADVSSRHIMR